MELTIDSDLSNVTSGLDRIESALKKIEGVLKDIKSTTDPLTKTIQMIVGLFGRVVNFSFDNLSDGLLAVGASALSIVYGITKVEDFLGKLKKSTVFGGIYKKFIAFGEAIHFKMLLAGEHIGDFASSAGRHIGNFVDASIRYLGDFASATKEKFQLATRAVQTKITAMGGLKMAFFKVLLPIALVAAAIAGIVFVIRHLWETNEGFRDFVISAWERIRGVFDAVIGFITDLFTDFSGTISRVWEGIQNFFSNIDPSMIFDIFKRLLPTIIAKLVGGLPGLLIKGVQIIGKIADGMDKTIPELINKATEIIVDFIHKAGEKIPEVISMGIEILLSLVDGILAALPSLIEAAVGLITTVVSMLVEKLPIIIEAGIEILKALIDGIVTVLPDLIDAAINLIISIVDALIENLQVIIEAGIDILLALVDGIVTMLPALIEAAINLIIQVVGALIGNLDLIISAGIEILLALVSGIWQIVGALVSVAGDLIGQFISAIVGMFGQIKTKGREILTNVVDGIRQSISNVVNTARDIVTSFIDGIRNKISTIKNLGRDIIRGFIDGITGMFSNIRDVISRVANLIPGPIRRILGINSPSRVMRDTVGEPIVAGICAGIDENADKPVKSMADLGDKIGQDGLINGESIGDQYGQSIMESLASGLEDGQGAVTNVAKSTADVVTDELSKATAVQNKLQAVTSKLANTKNKYADQAAAMMQAGLESAQAVRQGLDNMLMGTNLDQQLALAVTPPDASYQMNLMEKLIDTVAAGQTIVMDSGELVGATYAGYDNAAGTAMSYNSRWGR
ncbi:MAG: hypothetical protein FWG67_00565 [Defluviitaleaceae bacterium]|nr:hypothetical protein [Defluviitaleaceae bacterium]